MSRGLFNSLITYIGDEHVFVWRAKSWYPGYQRLLTGESIWDYPEEFFTVETSGIRDGDSCECGGFFEHDGDGGDLVCESCDTFEFELPMSDAKLNLRTRWMSEGSKAK